MEFQKTGEGWMFVCQTCNDAMYSIRGKLAYREIIEIALRGERVAESEKIYVLKQILKELKNNKRRR
ncbi:MAG: hypothetical protein EPO20_30545 [Betaproteobacteria bacterium]|nr:MAG: hypothetical protein EPO20_30545 [Betaproteobacteria bacterium]